MYKYKVRYQYFVTGMMCITRCKLRKMSTEVSYKLWRRQFCCI